ncbi:MAG: hypothetical protein Kow0025_10940 [Thermodesulfovibrionales bacterium]
MGKAGREILEMAFAAGGFVCAGCAEDVETFLRETDGVLEVEANYREDTVRVVFDPGKTSKREILERLVRTGFRPRPARG